MIQYMKILWLLIQIVYFFNIYIESDDSIDFETKQNLIEKIKLETLYDNLEQKLSVPLPDKINVNVIRQKEEIINKVGLDFYEKVVDYLVNHHDITDISLKNEFGADKLIDIRHIEEILILEKSNEK